MNMNKPNWRQSTPIGESTARLLHAHTLGEFDDEGGSGTVESLAVESYDAQQEITGDENDPESYMAGYCAALYEQAQPLLHLLAAHPEVAALRSTIAQLQGWIAELESFK